MNFREKLIEWDRLPEWRQTVRSTGKKLVVTNGCFDLLHLGHVTYLNEARKLGDLLLVGVNSDASVRELKGPGRPVNTERDRALVLAALECVDAVCIFPGRTAVGLLQVVRPDIHVKGGDYTLENINQEERNLVEKNGGKVVVAPLVPGRSTTTILEHIHKG